MTRADGIHWRTGPAPDGRDGPADPIFDVLTSESPTVLNEPEAQWHWAAVADRRPNGLTVWRASPEAKPAQRNWDAHAFSRDVFKNLDAHYARTAECPSDVLLLNELNLNYERGDSENDVDPSMWRARYATLSAFLMNLLTECRARAADRGWRPRFWFQAWAPGHGERDYANLWGPVARAYDGVCLHAYDSLLTITESVLWYAEQFPDQPLLLGEWNAPQSLTEEAAIRSRLRSLCDAIPRLQCCYFIWRWLQDSANRTYDIEGVDARLALWDGRVTLPADDWAPADQEIPMPDFPLGIDVSNHQRQIDWGAVAASGVAFAFAKATEGTHYIDPYFAPNWAGMRAHGIVRGAYHFAQPDQNEPEDEANLFVNHVTATGLEAGDLLALDLETGSGNLGAWAIRFLEAVEARVGYKALLYSSPAFISEHGLARPELADNGLWLASWGVQVPVPPAPWPVVAIHQYTDNGSVPGISGPVDMDRYNGDISTLSLYGKPAAEPPTQGYSVGQGIADRMAALGDAPASDERFLALWSEAIGRSGVRYVYWKKTGEITMYPPAA